MLLPPQNRGEVQKDNLLVITITDQQSALHLRIVSLGKLSMNTNLLTDLDDNKRYVFCLFQIQHNRTL